MTLQRTAKAVGQGNDRHGDKFSVGPQQAAMLRAIFPQAVFLLQNTAIHAPINLQSSQLYLNAMP